MRNLFSAAFVYMEKADLSRGYPNAKRELGVTAHFQIIIIIQRRNRVAIFIICKEVVLPKYLFFLVPKYHGLKDVKLAANCHSNTLCQCDTLRTVPPFAVLSILRIAGMVREIHDKFLEEYIFCLLMQRYFPRLLSKIWKEKAIHSLHFKAFLELWLLNYLL